MIEDIYTSFVTEMKKYLDVVKIDKSVTNQKRNFFYNVLSTYSKFVNVDKTKFKKLSFALKMSKNEKG